MERVTLASGTRLGPYEVVARIGAGGMGEVWRARDTRLDRDVAIKILPDEFAHDAQLQLRFEREARAISQLNHPYICTLYDVGKAMSPDGRVVAFRVVGGNTQNDLYGCRGRGEAGSVRRKSLQRGGRFVFARRSMDRLRSERVGKVRGL